MRPRFVLNRPRAAAARVAIASSQPLAAAATLAVVVPASLAAATARSFTAAAAVAPGKAPSATAPRKTGTKMNKLSIDRVPLKDRRVVRQRRR